MSKRLTDKHPDYKLVAAVFEFMEQKGVSFTYGPYGETTAKVNGKVYSLQDLDSAGNTIDTFPPFLEYKLLVPEDDE